MKEKNIKNLPEYQNVEFSTFDNSEWHRIDNDRSEFDDNTLVNQILSVDPNTGFPRNDLDVLLTTTNSEVRDYLLRCIKQLQPISNGDLSDEDLESVTYNRFDNNQQYIERLQKIIEDIDNKKIMDDA